MSSEPTPSSNATTNVRTSLDKLNKSIKDKDGLSGSKEALAASSISSGGLVVSMDASKKGTSNSATTTNNNNNSSSTATTTTTTSTVMNNTTNANIEKAAEVGQRIYENSYRMAPERKFPTELAKKLTQDILIQCLSKTTYSSEKAPDLSKQIAKDIIQAMKGLNLDRYKFVADVSIGEFRGQGIRSSSRALWDQTTDSFTSATFRNSSLFCVAIVFGVYFE